MYKTKKTKNLENSIIELVSEKYNLKGNISNILIKNKKYKLKIKDYISVIKTLDNAKKDWEKALKYIIRYQIALKSLSVADPIYREANELLEKYDIKPISKSLGL